MLCNSDANLKSHLDCSEALPMLEVLMKLVVMYIQVDRHAHDVLDTAHIPFLMGFVF